MPFTHLATIIDSRYIYTEVYLDDTTLYYCTASQVIEDNDEKNRLHRLKACINKAVSKVYINKELAQLMED